VASSMSPDRTLLALHAALDAVDIALRSGDAMPMMSDDVRGELTEKWTYIVSEMVQHRARTVRGRRVKALTLQRLHDKMQPAPDLFTDLAISLSLDLVRPLQRDVTR
jgi:hypothetical protein